MIKSTVALEMTETHPSNVFKTWMCLQLLLVVLLRILGDQYNIASGATVDRVGEWPAAACTKQ